MNALHNEHDDALNQTIHDLLTGPQWKIHVLFYLITYMYVMEFVGFVLLSVMTVMNIYVNMICCCYIHHASRMLFKKRTHIFHILADNYLLRRDGDGMLIVLVAVGIVVWTVAHFYYYLYLMPLFILYALGVLWRTVLMLRAK